MGGMFVGMLPAVTKTIIDAHMLSSGAESATLAAATSGLSMASGIAFGVGQIAMLAYAGNRARQGFAIRDILNENRELFNKHAQLAISADTRAAILRIVDKDIDFNKKTRIQYGIATAVGQTAMATATILNLAPGVGTIASIPFIAVGAPVTIGAAIWRIVYEKKESKFRGEDGENPYSEELKKKTDLSDLFARSTEQGGNDHYVMQALETEFKTCSNQLAHIKLFSLLRTFISHSRTDGMNPRFRDGKFAYLKKILPAITEPTPPQVDLGSLATWYQASKKQFDEDPVFKKEAQQAVVALQSGEEASKSVWEHICAISRTAYQQIYDLLDIHITERGESFYNRMLAPVIQQLEQQNLLTLSEGAKCIYLEGFTNREGEPLPLILQKSDGGYNYATTDMAALQHRIQKEHGDWLIYVTDAGQALHFQMVFAASQKANIYDPQKIRLDHVPFGLVLKADGKKFQTRSGKTERLIDLLQTAIEHAKQKLKEHNPDISETVLEDSAKVLGINAVKYADLSCHRLSDYVFSYDKMLQFEGNTAAFLLYAYVRIQSIQRKVKVDIASLLANNTSIILEDPTEIALGLLVCQFNEILENCVRELLPNRLTDYLYRLAEKFHSFFHQCRVEGSDNQNSRLLLCFATAQVLHQGLLLLGLKPLERM